MPCEFVFYAVYLPKLGNFCCRKHFFIAHNFREWLGTLMLGLMEYSTQCIWVLAHKTYLLIGSKQYFSSSNHYLSILVVIATRLESVLCLLSLVPGDLLSGKIKCCKNKKEPRSLIIQLQVELSSFFPNCEPVSFQQHYFLR